MKRRDVWLGFVLVMGFSLLSHAAPLSAQTFQPVFTKQYTRVAGTPVTTFDLFTACDPRGSFRVVVLNGPGGQGRISAGSIFLNGLEVIKEQDFNQQVAQIVRPLTNIVQDNRLEARLRSGPGAVIQVAVEGVQACGVRITSPAPGSTLTDPLVLVRGTVPVPPGGQVGVTVNGVAGLVEGDQFAALVPVDPSATSLTANANDFTGTINSDTIAVTVLAGPPEPAVRLQANRPGGVTPLSVSFELSAIIGVSQVALDADGDGVVDFQGATLEGRTFTYTRPGLYVPTARVTDTQGAVHTAVTLVHVIDPIALDLRLQAVWNGLKDALRAGDVGGAARFLHTDSRARYHAQLARLSVAAFTNIDQQMTTIQLVEVGFAGAQYEMLRFRDGQMLSFAVWFQLDQDGLWRLRRF